MSSAERFEAHRVVEKLGGFGGREAQIGGAQFGQLAAGAQPGQREWRILSGGDDQLHLRRQVIEQEGQRLDRSVWNRARGSHQGRG